MFNHSVRSYLFGELLAAHDGIRPHTDYDSETLFLGCVLHNVGVGTAAAGKARFEIEGADLAASLLTEHGCERAVVDAVSGRRSRCTVRSRIAQRRGADLLPGQRWRGQSTSAETPSSSTSRQPRRSTHCTHGSRWRLR